MGLTRAEKSDKEDGFANFEFNGKNLVINREGYMTGKEPKWNILDLGKIKK